MKHIRKFNEKLDYYDIITDLEEFVKDYLPYLFDNECKIRMVPYGSGFRMMISINSNILLGDLIYDIIPFYQILIDKYDIGVVSEMGNNIGEVRYASLQLAKTPNESVELVKLGKTDLIEKDISEYLDKYLSVISFYFNYNWPD